MEYITAKIQTPEGWRVVHQYKSMETVEDLWAVILSDTETPWQNNNS